MKLGDKLHLPLPRQGTETLDESSKDEATIWLHLPLPRQGTETNFRFIL